MHYSGIVTFLALLLLSVVAPTLQVARCGDGKTSFKIRDGFCYFFKGGSYQQKTALDFCRNIGAELTSASSGDEMDYIALSMKPLAYHSFWIGMRKDKIDPNIPLKDNYYWIDGTEKTFERWMPNEPNDQNMRENCVESYPKGLVGSWNDIRCENYLNGFACKTKLIEGWPEYNGYQYFVSYETEHIYKTWYEARDWCMQNGAELASVLSDGERNQITAWATKGYFDGGLWIGMNKLAGKRDTWQWSDQQPTGTYINWKKNYPIENSNLNWGHLCGYQASKDKDGKWMNGHCDEGNKGFICKRPSTTGTPTPKTTPVTSKIEGYCPQDYVAVGNKCFRPVALNGDDRLDFNGAVKECRKGPGFLPDLASINNEREQAYVMSQLQTTTFGLWIGLHRGSYSESWRWTDSAPSVYNNWAPGQPSESTHHCVEIWHELGQEGTWNNVLCSDKRGYVCETYKDRDSIIWSTPQHTPSSCPNGFTAYWSGCYKYQPEMVTWQTAKKMCEDVDAMLVTIHAAAENAAAQTVAIEKGNLWTGFADLEGTGQYSWLDNGMVFYTNWKPGQPVRPVGGGCVLMDGEGEWSDTNCNENHASLCKISLDPPFTIPPVSTGTCLSSDWKDHGDFCYFFETRYTEKWNSAKNTCAGKHPLATLASIHNRGENEFIHNSLEDLGAGRSSVWIGLYRSRLAEDEFHWLDLSPVQFEAWAPGEPNGAGTGQDCVEYYNQYWPKMWNDHDCDEYKGYVCKVIKLPYPTIPTAKPNKCEEGWEHYGWHCYYFQPDTLRNYRYAQEECEKAGGPGASLVSIHSNLDNDYIKSRMTALSALPVQKDFWIGMSKEGADKPYLWDDGTEVKYEFWQPGQPDDAHYDWENCVKASINAGDWDDYDCSTVLGFVCKIRAKEDETSGGLSSGAIAGIVIGVLVLVVLLTVVVLFVLTRQNIIDNPVEKIKSGISNPSFLDRSVSYEKDVA